MAKSRTSAALIAAIAKDYDDRPLGSLDVPEWGIKIFFKPLTMKESRSIRAGHGGDEESMVVSAVLEKSLDKDGEQIFEGDAADRALLESKAQQPIMAKIMQAMGLGEETVDKAKKD